MTEPKWTCARGACALVLTALACGDESATKDQNTAAGAGPAAADGGASSGPGASTDGAASPDAPRGPDLPPEGGAITGAALAFERSTPEQIGLHVRLERALPEDARMTVRYWPAGESSWRVAHPLLRIHPEWIAGGAPEAPVDGFAGTVFDLKPGTATMVELTLEVPGQPSEVMWKTVSTRALPAPAPAAAAAATTKIAPGADLQAALDALAPGQVLELADGTYDVEQLRLRKSGTEAAPIYVRGATRDGVIVRDTTGNVLQILEASHVIVENLTLVGSGVDSGTDASSVGVSFWNGGATQEHVTLRNLDVRGVDKGVIASGAVRSVLIYDSVLRGNNVWTQPFVESNLTWNDDGLRLPGEGNCAFQNTLHGFGDSFAVTNGVHSAAVYFYRNRVTMTGDDAFEGDYGTRNLAFYDNYVTNASTLMSLDPLWGGPLYCFRNVAINTVRGPFKLNATNSGFLIYSNTVVRTQGTTSWGWVQYDNGALRNWAFRNNILVYRGGPQLLAIESSGNTLIDFTHNGFYPDGPIWWSTTGGSYASLTAARSGLPATKPLFGASTARHDADLAFTADPFAATVPLGPDHLTAIDASPVPSLDAASPAKHAGVALANITDGFEGAAPDMGAIIAGRSVPAFGATRP